MRPAGQHRGGERPPGGSGGAGACGDADAELYRAAEERVRELCRRHRIKEPTLALDLRGRAAGRADRARNHVRLNPVLFRENFDAFLRQTIPHELCHLWKHQLGLGGRSHGEEWQRLMRLMGAEPRRTHSFDTSRAIVRRVRRHPYRCACRTHRISQIIHQRIGRGRVYRCRACRSPLEPQTDRQTKGGVNR